MGAVEVTIESKGKGKKPKFSEWEIKDACDTLIRAEEIQKNEELMQYVRGIIEKRKEAISFIDKRTKSIKPKSLDDLRKMANESMDED